MIINLLIDWVTAARQPSKVQIKNASAVLLVEQTFATSAIGAD